MSHLSHEQVQQSNVEAISLFAQLLQEGFENPYGIRGAVQFRIFEYPESTFFAIFDQQHLRIMSKLEQGIPVAAEIGMPITTLRQIVDECEYFDWCAPDIVGAVEFSGDLNLVKHLSKACLRPSIQTQRRLRCAEKTHMLKGYAKLEQPTNLESPTQMQVLEQMEAGMPTIVHGIQNIVPYRNWTFECLVERYADVVIPFHTTFSQQTIRELAKELKSLKPSSRKVAVNVFSKLYVENVNLPVEMFADFGPPYFDHGDFTPPKLSLGIIPTRLLVSDLHRNPFHKFLGQVIGRKRLDLYSADQSELLYPMLGYNSYQTCWFKPEIPDYQLFPLSKSSKCLSIILNPGDLFIQPVGWFYQAHALDSHNMSVSYFWRY